MKDFKLSDYGAYGDNVHNDQEAINKAIADCAERGGRVVFQSGHIYRSGTVIMKSHVELFFEVGSMLKASSNLADFDLNKLKLDVDKMDVPSYVNCDYNGQPRLFFLYGKDLEDVKITGLGIIDGNEEIFYGKISPTFIDGAFYPRVPLLFFEGCRNVQIKDVTFQRSGFWTTHLVGCQNVDVEGLKIKNNMLLANCDGIDPDHCKHVRIRHCQIDCADDCIVLKNTSGAKQYGACQDIEVSDCVLQTSSAAIKFGTESVSLFKDVYFHDIQIKRANRGISLQLRDEGGIENVKFQRISIQTELMDPLTWWGKAEPIAVTAVRRKKDSQVGEIKDLVFEDIECEGENGIFIYGEKNRNIKNISLKNVSISLKKKTDYPKDRHDLRPAEEYGIFTGKLTGLYIRNADQVKTENLSFVLDEAMKKIPFVEKDVDK